MSEDRVPKQKPIPIEKRQNLFYNSNKRRSLPVLLFISVAAVLAGIFIAYTLKGLSELRVSGADTSRTRLQMHSGAATFSTHQDRHIRG